MARHPLTDFLSRNFRLLFAMIRLAIGIAVDEVELRAFILSLGDKGFLRLRSLAAICAGLKKHPPFTKS